MPEDFANEKHRWRPVLADALHALLAAGIDAVGLELGAVGFE
jgi:hypothetical protein